MATVYTHIRDVVKRSISYIEQRLEELEDEWNTTDDEREMWVELSKLKIKGLDKSFLAERASYCKKQCKELLAEEQDFERVLKALGPCDNCGGSGQLVEHVAQDEARYLTCPKCGGKGYGVNDTQRAG